MVGARLKDRRFIVPSSRIATMNEHHPELAGSMVVLSDEVVSQEIFMKSMEPLLVPLTSEQIRVCEDTDCLVDVAVLRPHEGVVIYTFDPLRLPAYCSEDFLDHLFQWATLEGFQPVSSYGCWPGKSVGTNAAYALLPVYAEWLDSVWALAKGPGGTR